ncbi:tyrosine-type recombinase/integrase [Streptomyces sp. NPDC006978]|uniref:tyrosine-type recombinase/integrase n=1 Tax=Streptomyces sp. NPDC006978 TaxID=3364769 RepID=UPI0036B9A4C9
MVASAAHGKGKRWQARYDDPNGKEITSLWGTKVEAEREVNRQESAKQTGSWLDPRAGRVTIERFALDTWLPAQSMISRSEVEVLGLLRRHLFSEWGPREMRSIKPSEAGAWQKLLITKYKLSGATPNRVARFARSIFRLAVIDRIIPVSPFEKITAPKLVEKEVQPPDVAEVRQLIAAAYNDRWCNMLEFTALTGLRSGEVRGLRLDRIDFLRRTILVDQQLVQEKGRGLYFDDLKTDAGLRTLPVTQRVLDLVAAYVQTHPVPAGGQGAGLVFTMPASELISRSTLDYAIKSICKKAGVKPRHWHELRHHYASVLIAGGESPKVVQKRLGHKDVMTTLRTYAHLFAEAEEQTRDVLDAAWTLPVAGKESPETSGRIPERRPASGVVSQLRA